MVIIVALESHLAYSDILSQTGKMDSLHYLLRKEN